MKRGSFFVALSFVLLGCGNEDAGPSKVAGNEPNGGLAQDNDAGTQPDDLGEVLPPERLAGDATLIIGVTEDDHVIYRSSQGLTAVAAAPGANPTLISADTGTVFVRGPLVYQWTAPDWDAGLGDLMLWTARYGAHSVGSTLFGEDRVTIAADSTRILFVENVDEESADLVLASPDLDLRIVLIDGMGRGNADTCRASFGFAGSTPVAAWCEPGVRSARLERFVPGAGEQTFVPETLAEGVRTLWSASSDGNRLFYIAEDSQAYVLEAGRATPVDRGVGWGIISEDGNTVYYGVGDQLRRAAFPDLRPETLITQGVEQRAGFSPDLSQLLYSTTISYEDGTRRDLFLSGTSAFNPAPKVLSADPRARLPRSLFSSDSQWAMFLTDTAEGVPVLNLYSVDGPDSRTLDGVVDALAARDSRIVFSDNPSPPGTWPMTADLKVLEPSGSTALMMAGVSDGRNFHVTRDKSNVLYIRPPSAEATDVQGLYIQRIP